SVSRRAILGLTRRRRRLRKIGMNNHSDIRAGLRPPSQRAVVTGLGIMSGLGHDVDTFWRGLLAGSSAIRCWVDKDPRIASKVGGDQSDFSLPSYLQRAESACPSPRWAELPRLLRGTGLGTHLTACAALQAYVDAGADGQVAPERFAHLCA